MQLAFILVSPARPANVGAAARALITMGHTDLRVVASDAHRADEARWVAHGAESVLDGVQAFDTLEQALQGCDFVVATTARRRGCKRSYWSPQALHQQLQDKAAALGRVAILFGCEESGLPNSAIEQADLLSAIPLAQPQPSLNLAQAVMIYSYALSGLAGETLPEPSPQSEWQMLQQRLSALLGEAGISADPKLLEWIQDRTALASQRDIRMLHTLSRDLYSALNRAE